MDMQEEKRGLWANIHAKRKRIKAGSGERMRKPGSKGAPTDADFKAASRNEEVHVKDTDDYKLDKSGKKVKAHKIVFNKGEDDGKKGVSEQMTKSYNRFVQEHTPDLTEEQLNELVAELQEVLGKDDPAGKWISDFVHSDNPKFAGKSKEKRKQMALAAYYAKMREEVEQTNEENMKEELKGNQHKLDKNKNGKLDAHDFKLLRKEDAEQVDEAESHQAKTTMKHVKNATAGEKKAAKDIKPGVAGYRDRIAMLKSAEARGGLKKEEVEQVDEASTELPSSTHGSHSVKSKVFSNKEGYHKDDYVGMDTTIHKGTVQHKDNSKPTKFEVHNKPNGLHWQTNHSPEEKKAIAAHLTKHKYFNAKGFIGKDPANIHEEVEQVDEAWPGTPEYEKKFPKRVTGAGARHDIKATSTGVVATRRFAADDTAEKPENAPKRGRGRPKKDKFAEAVEFLMCLDEESFDSLMEEGFDSFMEHFEQLDEISKATLSSYVKKASDDAVSQMSKTHRAYDQAQDAKERSKDPKLSYARKGNEILFKSAMSSAEKYRSKSDKRLAGINKAADRLSK